MPARIEIQFHVQMKSKELIIIKALFHLSGVHFVNPTPLLTKTMFYVTPGSIISFFTTSLKVFIDLPLLLIP